jgi:transglutaminase-like putative cysteine protease
MIRMHFDLELNYDISSPGSDFVFNIHAAQTACQRVHIEQLSLNQPVSTEMYCDALTGNRYMRLRADQGALRVLYQATIDVTHYVSTPELVCEVPVCRLPMSVFPYLYPSRYCQSDRLVKLAIREFGGLSMGYSRILAIQQWVRDHVSFASNTTDSKTSAIDTLVNQVGVCRDFAHLMIALCRALSIPARFVSGTDYGADPSLGPPDFHAYVEVFLSDRWYLFDPSGTTIPMGLIRIGTGRDAADVSFATIFGTVQSSAPRIVMNASIDPSLGHTPPVLSHQALSTAV